MIFCFRTSFPVLEHPFPVLERLFPVLEHLFPVLERLFLFWNVLFLFLCSFGQVILSRDGTGQRSLSRDICSCPCPRTKGHQDKNFFCPGTSRPVETLVLRSDTYGLSQDTCDKNILHVKHRSL